jgi:hypothetical protein
MLQTHFQVEKQYCSIYVPMYVCTYVCVYVCTYVRIYVLRTMYVCTYVCMYRILLRSLACTEFNLWECFEKSINPLKPKLV